MMLPGGDKRRRAEPELRESIDRQVQRIERAKRDQRTVIGYTVYLGTLGLLFVLPVLAGGYLGRWIDSQLQGYSVRWTISLILVGVFVGAVNVYLFIRE